MSDLDLEIGDLFLVLGHVTVPLSLDLLFFLLVLGLGQLNFVNLGLHRQHAVLLRLKLARDALIVPTQRGCLLLDRLEL